MNALNPKVQVIDGELVRKVLAGARRSPRRRLNCNLHATPEENPNRFLNALLAGTYVAPHRHLEPPKPELFLVLEGRVAVFVFDDAGEVEQSVVLDAGMGIDMAPGVWHTITVPGEHAVVLEVKPGFYDPATDKQFAPWAPREGEPGAGRYLEQLLSQVPA
ncbi:MAG: WbuC family cupin fold metalloprotein [Bryobacteraceae bacterium]